MKRKIFYEVSEKIMVFNLILIVEWLIVEYNLFPKFDKLEFKLPWQLLEWNWKQ